MAHKRSTLRPPSSTGVIKNYGGSNPAALLLSSSRSSESLIDDCVSSSTSKSGSQHGDVVSGLGRPSRRRPRRAEVVVAPGADPHYIRPGGLGGFEDPYYAASTAATSRHSGVNGNGASSSKSNSKVSIPVAVLLWYSLGVMSIVSSKLLLSTYGVPPFVLTVQQLIIGMTLLRTLLEMQTSGENDKDRLLRRGLQPVPMQFGGGPSSPDTRTNCPESYDYEAGVLKRKTINAVDTPGNVSSNHASILSAIFALVQTSNRSHIHNQLFLASIYFTLGFLFTNFGFQSGSAAFVETVKAAEPFTSATVAVLWGIERLGKEEVTSLTGVVAGVVLSTLGHRGSGGKAAAANGDALEIPSQSLATKCLIVMLSNLCFSFRGLHQKLFRATPQGNASIVDDLNLQYRMQQIGVLMLILPTILGNTSWALIKLKSVSIGGSVTKQAIEYILLSLVNGLAFTSYNLASTHVLTRISVVHHAALNCIRRIFAIVVTSMMFGLKITLLQVVGIGIAVSGFFSYIHFKMKKEVKDRRRKEMWKKWGGFIRDAKSGKWIGKSSSLLPVNTTVK